MSPALNDQWQPTASLSNLKLRAKILAQIREFFAKRQVMEVETPMLGQFAITDRHIKSLAVPISLQTTYFLQTSPEYAMKRLLATGSGCIFQICKAFRAEEQGPRHNPEFTMLEWYRVGFNHHQLMDEIDEFLHLILNTPRAKRVTYQQLFDQQFKLDIHTCSLEALQTLVHKNEWMRSEEAKQLDKDTCLQLLMTHGIEPGLGFSAPTFVYDFPSSQAALAKLSHDHPPVAQRFEIYIQGLEIANGFHELTDSIEQEQRFLNDLAQRQSAGEELFVVDQRLLAALKHGLPDCAGVALGIDRLIMLAAKETCIEKVLAFDWNHS